MMTESRPTYAKTARAATMTMVAYLCMFDKSLFYLGLLGCFPAGAPAFSATPRNRRKAFFAGRKRKLQSLFPVRGECRETHRYTTPRCAERFAKGICKPP